MEKLDVSHLPCPQALLEVKRWLRGQPTALPLTLILRADSADNQDILRWLTRQGIQANLRPLAANRLSVQFTHKDI